MITISTKLKEKLVDFQREISRLSLNLKNERNRFETDRKSLLLGYIELLDRIERIEQYQVEETTSPETTLQALTNGIAALKRKISSLLSSNGIEKITFPENRAVRETCRIVDTMADSSKRNETIVEIVRNGYTNNSDNSVLRKADVITIATVANDVP